MHRPACASVQILKPRFRFLLPSEVMSLIPLPAVFFFRRQFTVLESCMQGLLVGRDAGFVSQRFYSSFFEGYNIRIEPNRRTRLTLLPDFLTLLIRLKDWWACEAHVSIPKVGVAGEGAAYTTDLNCDWDCHQRMLWPIALG